MNCFQCEVKLHHFALSFAFNKNRKHQTIRTRNICFNIKCERMIVIIGLTHRYSVGYCTSTTSRHNDHSEFLIQILTVDFVGMIFMELNCFNVDSFKEKSFCFNVLPFSHQTFCQTFQCCTNQDTLIHRHTDSTFTIEHLDIQIAVSGCFLCSECLTMARDSPNVFCFHPNVQLPVNNIQVDQQLRTTTACNQQ